MTVPYTFANQVGTISLAELDANFSAVGNTITAATVTANAQPNITSVGTLTSLSVTGNVRGGYFAGNGAGLTNVVANVGSASELINGNTSLSIPTSNGNIVGIFGGTSNVYTFTNLGANIVGYINATSNVVFGGNLVGNGYRLTSINASNVSGIVANATYAVSATSAVRAGTVTTAAQPNITSVGILTSLSVTGTVTGNIGTLTNLTVANSIVGNVGRLTTMSVTGSILGNVGRLTTLSVTGNTNANYVAATTLSASGNVYTENVSASGNITGNYIIGDGSQLTNLPAGNYSNANVAAYLPTYTGNLAAGNAVFANNVTLNGLIIGNAIISLSGNIRGENFRTAGFVSAVGNVYGNNISASTALQLPVYASDTARNTAISSPQLGMFVITGTTPQIYNGATWGNITLT